MEVLRIHRERSVYYVDVQLGGFVNYGEQRDRANEQLEKFQKSLEGLKNHPLPPLREDPRVDGGQTGLTWTKDDEKPVPMRAGLRDTTQGYFFDLVVNQPGCWCPLPDTGRKKGLRKVVTFPCEESGKGSAWESVIEVVSQASSMKRCIFYRVAGFYSIGRRWYWPLRKERMIKLANRGWNTKYPLPMGSIVNLRLVFYRSNRAEQWMLDGKQKLTISAGGDGIAGLSRTEIPILSRYDEEQVEIACKRMLDSVLAPINISHDAGVHDDVLAAQPFLVARVKVPIGVIMLILAGLGTAPFLLTADANFFATLGNWSLIQKHWKDVGDCLVRNKDSFSLVAKATGAAVALGAGYLGLRRLPIGK